MSGILTASDEQNREDKIRQLCDFGTCISYEHMGSQSQFILNIRTEELSPIERKAGWRNVLCLPVESGRMGG